MCVWMRTRTSTRSTSTYTNTHIHTQAINKLLRYRIVARSLNVFRKTNERANERKSEHTSERQERGKNMEGTAEKKVANGRIYGFQRTIQHRYVLAGAVKIKAFLHLADTSLCVNTNANWNPVLSMPMRFERRTNCAAWLDFGAQMWMCK